MSRVLLYLVMMEHDDINRDLAGFKSYVTCYGEVKRLLLKGHDLEEIKKKMRLNDETVKRYEEIVRRNTNLLRI